MDIQWWCGIINHCKKSTQNFKLAHKSSFTAQLIKTKWRLIHDFLSVYWKHCYKIKVSVSWMISDLDMDASLNKIKYTRHSWNLFLLTEGLDWLGGFLGCEDGPGGLELVVLVIVPRGYTVHWLDSSLDKVLGLGVNPFIGDCFGLILRI